MATIIQKIFLSQKKLAEIDRKNEIMNLINGGLLMHNAYVTRTGSVVRRFTVKNNDFCIYSERHFDRLRTKEDQIQYTLRVNKEKHVIYASHGSIDPLAQTIYTKINKFWESNKENAR